MATVYDINLTDISLVADVDLTLYQYYWVVPASTVGNVKVATGASNPAPFGILQNSPSLGQEARVRVLGFSKAFALTGSGSGINWSRFTTTNASGQTAPTGTEAGSPINGRWFSAAVPVSACRFGNLFLLPFGACNTSAC